MLKKSELVLREEDGAIYHLGIKPEHLADTILLVGDPGRVEQISIFFDKIEFKHQNRELIYHLGRYNRNRIAVLSTGMGVDNIDIIVTELDALANLNIQTGEPLPQHRTLQLIRVGTCGILQPDIPLLSFIASEFGLGLDGMIYFYKTEKAKLHPELSNEFVQQMNWSPMLPKPYITSASNVLLNKLGDLCVRGITATAPGFYGPQGRYIRAEIIEPELGTKLSRLNLNGHKITNLEMETSCLYALSNILGHDALTVCLGIANRYTGDFSADYHKQMRELILNILDNIVK